jgi:hypothetical protein
MRGAPGTKTRRPVGIRIVVLLPNSSWVKFRHKLIIEKEKGIIKA